MREHTSIITFYDEIFLKLKNSFFCIFFISDQFLFKPGFYWMRLVGLDAIR